MTVNEQAGLVSDSSWRPLVPETEQGRQGRQILSLRGLRQECRTNQNAAGYRKSSDSHPNVMAPKRSAYR